MATTISPHPFYCPADAAFNAGFRITNPAHREFIFEYETNPGILQLAGFALCDYYGDREDSDHNAVIEDARCWVLTRNGRDALPDAEHEVFVLCDDCETQLHWQTANRSGVRHMLCPEHN